MSERAHGELSVNRTDTWDPDKWTAIDAQLQAAITNTARTLLPDTATHVELALHDDPADANTVIIRYALLIDTPC